MNDRARQVTDASGGSVWAKKKRVPEWMRI